MDSKLNFEIARIVSPELSFRPTLWLPEPVASYNSKTHVSLISLGGEVVKV
jgi:hypothetical protein